MFSKISSSDIGMELVGVWFITRFKTKSDIALLHGQETHLYYIVYKTPGSNQLLEEGECF